jgi:hypothetical protein
VRAKSHAVLKPLPPDEYLVIERKAVRPGEVLSLLPLSRKGFEVLRAGGPDAVRSLSRLQRLCRESGLDEDLIEDLCALKVRWHTWHAENRDRLQEDTLASIKESGLQLLREHVSTRSTFVALRAKCESAAQELSKIAGVPRSRAGMFLVSSSHCGPRGRLPMDELTHPFSLSQIL